MVSTCLGWCSASVMYSTVFAGEDLTVTFDMKFSEELTVGMMMRLGLGLGLCKS
jgi:hypothetical protein